ncbi:hypothetical protein PoB_005149500 [Plakobranchus ocellatus]|uniref:Uncharacterized protein n=1 Tax=Plakobranchus ocellatus TaxID=259542 RepID=A0AAV4C0U4_9GAST|nr:hypothetical protein PoB_005149500 [Plakobranchus ocellatus]
MADRNKSRFVLSMADRNRSNFYPFMVHRNKSRFVLFMADMNRSNFYPLMADRNKSRFVLFMADRNRSNFYPLIADRNKSRFVYGESVDRKRNEIRASPPGQIKHLQSLTRMTINSDLLRLLHKLKFQRYAHFTDTLLAPCVISAQYNW